MLDERIYIRVPKELKNCFIEILRRESREQQKFLRNFIKDYVKQYLIEEIQSVELPAEKALCDLGDLNIEPNVIVEVVFTREWVEYNRSDNSSNEPVQFTRDRWEDVFENYPELLEYALGVRL